MSPSSPPSTPCIWAFSVRVDAIADAKAEIFEGLEPGGAAVLNRDNPHFERCSGATRCRRKARIVGFGATRGAEARVVQCRAWPREFRGDRRHPRRDLVTYRLGVPGEHLVHEQPRRARRGEAGRRRPEGAALALGRMRAPQTGRGERIVIGDKAGAASPHRRKLQCQSGLDARGACRSRAHCRAMSSSAASPCSATCWSLARRGRRSMRSLPRHRRRRRRCRLRLRRADARLYECARRQTAAVPTPRPPSGSAPLLTRGWEPATWSWSRARSAAAWPAGRGPPAPFPVGRDRCPGVIFTDSEGFSLQYAGNPGSSAKSRFPRDAFALNEPPGEAHALFLIQSR